MDAVTAKEMNQKHQTSRSRGKPGNGKKYLFILPATIVVVGIIGYPLVRALIVSFFEYNPLNRNMTFNGLTNYIKLFTDSVFYQSVLNSVIWTFGNVFLQFSLGLIGAVLLNQKFRGRGIFRGLVLIPWATPSVLAALMWIWILDGNYGLLNDLLKTLGLIKIGIPWFSSEHTALGSLMLIDVWQGVPYFAIMLLASLQTVSHDLIEAAKLDGANRWTAFWKIVFPNMLPTVMITVLLRIIWTASYMDLVLIITQGGPGYSTLILPAYAYNKAYLDLNYGEATAMAVIQAVTLLAMVLVYARISSKHGLLDGEGK